MKRSIRRHHRARRIKAEYKKWLYTFDGDCDQATAHSRRTHSLRTPCSCYMCGNPRKHWGKETIQEQKAPKISDFFD